MTKKKRKPKPASKADSTVKRNSKNAPPPPVENRWKPGQSGNPAGRAPEPPELKALKNLTKKELVDIGNMVIKGDVVKLQKICDDQEESVLRVMIARVCMKVIAKGTMAELDILLNRLIGKVKDEVEHSGSGLLGAAPQVIVTLPSNGREAKKPA